MQYAPKAFMLAIVVTLAMHAAHAGDAGTSDRQINEVIVYCVRRPKLNTHSDPI